MKAKKLTKENKAMVDGLVLNWGAVSKEIWIIDQDLKKLQRRRSLLLSQLDGILKVLDMHDARPANLIVPPELQFKPNSTIGDAMEITLKEKGSLPKKELIEILAKAGFIKNPKNARVLIANAISKDGRRRFEVTMDGKVSLRQGKDSEASEK